MHIDGQERCNSTAIALELCRSCTNPSIYTELVHWTVSSLDQTVASLLFGIKPLSEPMQTCFQLNHKENVSMKYHLKYKIFSQENVFEYAVWNGNHLVSTEMRFNDCVQCWLKGVNKGERNIHGILMSHHWSVYCCNNFEFHGSANT